MKFNWIYSLFNSANKNWASRIFSIILIASVTYSVVKIFEAKGNSQVVDCSTQIKPYAEQVRILSQTLEQVSKAVDALTGSKPTSSLMSMASFSFANFKDTTARPMSQQQQRQELLLIKGKLDSAKRKLDSLNRIINKQQLQTKT